MPKITLKKAAPKSEAGKKDVKDEVNVKTDKINEASISKSPKTAVIAAGSEPVSESVKTRGLDFLINSVLFLIFLLCPLFFTGLTAQGMGFEKMILFYFLVLLGTVVWAAKAIVSGQLIIKRTPLDLPIIGILIFSVVSTILSVNQKASLIGSYGNSTKGLVGIIAFILFYYLLINNLNSKRIKLYFWTLISSCSLVTIFSLMQLLNIFVLPFEYAKSSSFNPIGSLSSLTMFLVIVLPLLVLTTAQADLICAKSKKIGILTAKLIIGAITLCGLVILAFLNNLTFWPAAIAGIVIMLLFLLSKIVKITHNNLVIPITIFFLLIIFQVMGNFNIMNYNFAKETNLPRNTAFEIAKNSLKEKPIFGAGPSTFHYSFSKFKEDGYNSTQFWNVRFGSSSVFLFELIASIGALGALGAIIFLIIALVYCYRSIIKSKSDDGKNILLSLFSSMVIIIILSSLFSFSASLIILSIMIFSLAIATAAVVYSDGGKEINLSFNISQKFNLLLATIFLLVSAGVISMFTMGIKIYMADLYAHQTVNNPVLEERVDKLNKAIKLAPYQDVYYLNLADSYIAMANKEAAGAQDLNKILTNLNQAKKNAEEAVKIAPEKTANQEFLALIYENISIYTKGGVLVWAKTLEGAYDKMLELEPNNPIPYFKKALISVAKANSEENKDEQNKYFSEAINYYDQAISKKPDFGDAYYGKGVAYEKLQNLNEAIEQIKTAINTSSNNVDYMFELGRLYFNRGIMKANVIAPDTNNIENDKAANGEGSSGEAAGDESNIADSSPESSSAKIERNEDINTAEQIFLNIAQAVKPHANALYSLAMLYQTVGETDNARAVVGELLKTNQPQEQMDKIKAQFKGLY